MESNHSRVKAIWRRLPEGLRTANASCRKQHFGPLPSAPVMYAWNMKTTVAEFSRDNLLVIPRSLYGMADARPVMTHGEAGIFHKLIQQDMRGFLTNLHGKAKRRSIRHLMRNHRLLNRNIQDFVMLSGRSPATFNRDFKRQFGETPLRWLIRARLDRAQELLTATDLSVTQIALEVGYENTSHFIKAFRERFGQTPKKARMELL